MDIDDLINKSDDRNVEEERNKQKLSALNLIEMNKYLNYYIFN